jgi:hypothetical protein
MDKIPYHGGSRTFLRGACRVILGWGAVGILAGCSHQGVAHNANPMCRQAEQKCKVYHETMERAKSDHGAGIDLLREDCEDSQRACAEGVNRSLESSHPEEPGNRKRSYFDY